MPPAIAAATVVVLRDGPEGLEVLMMRRSSRIAFGGMWTFPGGRVETGDRVGGETELQSARRAAVREAAEEADLALGPDDLVVVAHWEPPPVIERRFATWFFLARVRAGIDGDVHVDGREMEDHDWLTPGEVMSRRDRGEVELAPPTWVTLHDLAAHDDVESALAAARRLDQVPRYVTHWRDVDGGAVAMWHGDAGYETGDPGVPGPRHRLWMLERWHLERD